MSSMYIPNFWFKLVECLTLVPIIISRWLSAPKHWLRQSCLFIPTLTQCRSYSSFILTLTLRRSYSSFILTLTLHRSYSSIPTWTLRRPHLAALTLYQRSSFTSIRTFTTPSTHIAEVSMSLYSDGTFYLFISCSSWTAIHGKYYVVGWNYILVDRNPSPTFIATRIYSSDSADLVRDELLFQFAPYSIYHLISAAYIMQTRPRQLWRYSAKTTAYHLASYWGHQYKFSACPTNYSTHSHPS